MSGWLPPGQQQQAQFQYSQPTGYPQQPQQPLQPLQTGFNGANSGFLQPQRTGFPQQQFNQQQAPPPVPQIPTQYQSQYAQNQQPSQFSQFGVGNQPGLGANLGPQQQRFLSPSPGPLLSQPTGGAPLGSLLPQRTGVLDPRLALMSNTFMPANTAAPYAPSGAPQFAGGPPGTQSLQQSFQQVNLNNRGTAAPKVPWALSKEEKKNYDQIFRAWDTNNSGFISGEMASEVFGQSGLDRNDLATIWSLADADNRGKLNIQEFHVAMGLIYRRLNGNELPTVIPPEMEPVSSKNLNESVDFLTNLLRNDTQVLGTGDSRGKVHSFRSGSGNNSPSPRPDPRKDGSIYKHDDTNVRGYASSSRRINRDDIRSSSQNTPTDDLSDIKRQLATTGDRLEKARAEAESRSAEDEALAQELDDLKYKVRRVQEDIDYVSRGPRASSKEAERRKLERELYDLMYKDVPAVEKRIEERERQKKKEKDEWSRDRDRRNGGTRSRYEDDRDRHRYRDRERDQGEYDRDRRGGDYSDDEEDRDTGYLRGTFDRNRDAPSSRRNREDSRDRDDEYERRDKEKEYGRERDRNLRRPSPPPASRSPAPPPPAAAASASLDAPRPPAPAPSASPAPQTKSMTPAERSAFIRQQAQQRLQERMKALGVSGAAPAAGSPVDTSVEDRLASERKEAEDKARQAEKDAEERETQRRQRLEGERAAKSPPTVAAAKSLPPPTPPAPAPSSQGASKAAPPPPMKRSGKPAPPPPSRPLGGLRTPSIASPVSAPPAPPAPRPVAAPVVPPAPRIPLAPPTPVALPAQDDDDDAAFRAREEALKKKRAARQAELERLEAEARREEEEYEAKMTALRQRKETPSRTATPLAPPTQSSIPATNGHTAIALAAPILSPTPVAPPAPPAPVAPTPVVAAPRNNPFHKLQQQGSAAPSPVTAPTANPWANPTPTAASTEDTPIPPAPPAPPAPPVVQAPVTPRFVPAKSLSTADLEDWDDPVEKNGSDDSSDDEIINRTARINIANQIFGGRKSAGPESQPGDTPDAPPAPPAPRNIPVFTPTTEPADRGALFSSIATGAKLRPTKTNDRSASQFAGAVVGGDVAPPTHINEAPRPPSPHASDDHAASALYPPEGSTMSSRSRLSVDWYAGLASDQLSPSRGTASVISHEATISEDPESDDDEEQHTRPEQLPNISIQAPPSDFDGTYATTPVAEADPLADVDLSTTHQVRSLYAYTGQRDEDLVFGENLIISAHPSKSGTDWWYGTLVKEGTKGFFPQSYVAVIEQSVQAKALYTYVGGSAEELPFSEGDTLTIVDRSEGDWWKADKGGVVFLVPAAYLEVIDVDGITNPLLPHTLESTESTQPMSPSERDPASTPEPDNRLSVVSIPESSTSQSPSPDGYDSESSDYMSFDEGGNDDEMEGNRKEHAQEREAERQRVLSAAGLKINVDPSNVPPVPPRRRKLTTIKTKSRRAPPPIPDSEPRSPSHINRDLPPTPTSPGPSLLASEDAYDKYEQYKQANRNRFSIASTATDNTTLTTPTGSGPPSIMGPTFSSKEDGHSRHSGGSGLFSFLRSSTQTGSTNSSERRPVISGPMPIAQPSEINRAPSPAFGMSWSTVIDKTVLEGIPQSERRRQEAIFEMIATEGAYVRDLQLIVETFYSPLLRILSEEELNAVFANIEELLLCNTTFLSSLEDRQRQSRLYIDTISDILASHVPSFDIYARYCVDQGNAIKFLQSLRESKPDVDALLNTLKNDPSSRNLDLSSYLLVPMQRITRYPLLIKQITQNTDSDDEKSRLHSASMVIEGILDRINEAIRDREGRETLAAISQHLWIGQGRLDLTADTRDMGPRRLIKEGVLLKAKSGRRLKAFLCSDIIVLTDASARSLYRMPIPLSEVKVSNKDDMTFELSMPYPRGGDSIRLRTSSTRECADWLKAIEKAARQCRKAAAAAKLRV